MPFTGAHPMAVLPLLRSRHLDATCLVLGAMAPDFEYFAHGEQAGNFGHTWLGLVLWSVPVTLVLAWLFHAFVKDPLLLVAPRAVASRLARTTWHLAWLPCIASAAIGDVTHLVWDAFTHDEGWAVARIGWLQHTIDLPVVHTLSYARVLQYICSLVGLLVLAIYFVWALQRRRAVPLPDVPRAVPRLIFAACLVVGVAVLWWNLHRMHAHDPGSRVVGTISGLLAGTLLASALLRKPAARLHEA